MQLTIEASSVAELRTKLILVAAELQPFTPTPQVPLSVDIPSTKDAATVSTLATRKRGPAKKVAKTEEPLPGTPEGDQIEDESTHGADEPKKPAAKADVLAAISKVNSLKGITAARQVLADFGCTRVSELETHHWEKFIEACDLAV